MGMKCTVWGIQSGIMCYLYMVTACGWTYCGDHFDMYSDTKSLCHITVTNIVFRLIILQNQPTNQTNPEKKRSDLQLPETRDWAERELDDSGQKVQTYKMSK